MPSIGKGKNSQPKKKEFTTLVKKILKNISGHLSDALISALSSLKRNSGNIFRLVSVFTVAAIIWIVIKLFLPLFWSPLATGIYSLNYPSQLDSSRPTINLILGEPDWSSTYPVVSVDYDGKVELAQKLIWEKGGCFGGLYFMDTLEKNAFVEPKRRVRGADPIIYLNPRVCFDSSNQKIPIAENPNWTSAISDPRISGIPPYYYPFDWGELIVRTHLEGNENTGFYSPGINIPFNMTGYISAKNWDVKISTTDEPIPPSPLDAINSPNVLLDVRYERPMIYKVIPVVLLITILLIIIYLPFIMEPSSFLEVLVGLIFGIWGIKQIIIPTFVTWTTILEPIILGLYMCLCISVFIKFIVMPLQTKIDKFSQNKNG